jgi:hypothetical protein
MTRDGASVKEDLKKAVTRRRAELGHIGRIQASIVNDTREIGRLLDELCMIRREETVKAETVPESPEGLYITGVK